MNRMARGLLVVAALGVTTPALAQWGQYSDRDYRADRGYSYDRGHRDDRDHRRNRELRRGWHPHPWRYRSRVCWWRYHHRVCRWR